MTQPNLRRKVAVAMPQLETLLVIEDSEEVQTPWDEDDIILFLWGNSPAEIERHHKKQEEITQYMEQWRQAVQ